MSLFSGFGGQRRKQILVVRPGTEELDFLLFEEGAGEAKPLVFGSETIGRSGVKKTLEELWSRLSGQGAIRELVATFSASQFKARIVREGMAERSTRERRRLGESEAAALEREIVKRAEKRARETLIADSGILPHEFSLRRLSVLERRIDGYPVPRLKGFERGDVEFSVLGMFLLEKPFIPVEEFARAHRVKVSVKHLAEGIRFFAKERKRSGVYLCVEEEKTQIVVVKEGILGFVGSVPKGERQFREFFREAFGMKSSFVKSLQEAWRLGTLSAEVRQKVRQALLPEQKAFGTMIQEKLAEAKMVLPESLWLFGRIAFVRGFGERFAEDLSREVVFSEAPRARVLLPKAVWPAREFAEVRDSLHTALVLLGNETREK